MPTPYETLGVRKGASDEQISAAYKRQAKRHHPDAPGCSADAFQPIARAYALIATEAKRKRYDEHGEPDESTTIEEDAHEHIGDMLTAIMKGEADPSARPIAAALLAQVDGDLGQINAKIHEMEMVKKRAKHIAKRFRVHIIDSLGFECRADEFAAWLDPINATSAEMLAFFRMRESRQASSAP